MSSVSMVSYHQSIHFYFTNLIILTQPFYKSFRKRAALFRQPLLIFPVIFVLFSILKRNVRYVMSHILVRRTDNLSFVYQLLNPVR